MSTFFTADLHLGETRFEIMARPFKTPQDHVDHLVKCHNELVKPDDRVIVVGDVLFKEADPTLWMPQINRFNGVKVLLRGNHDAPFSDEQFAPYFQEVIAEGKGIELKVGDIDCHVVHYPVCARPDVFNIVGHIHGLWKLQPNMINVGVDAHHFYPTSDSQIVFFHTAINKFYDQDAFAAYLPQNANHPVRELIEARGSYFKGSPRPVY